VLLYDPQHYLELGRHAGNATAFPGRRHSPLELREGRAGERVNVPRLQIAARCRPSRARDQLAHQCGIDRPVKKAAAGNAGIDGFEHVHGVTIAWG